MLELYYFPPSRCSKKVKMALVEKGIPHKTHFVNLWKYDHLTPEYLELNPKGLVPVIVHDGKVITESDEINQYIDKHFEGKKLVPDTDEGKEKMMEWIRLQDNYPRLSWRVISIKNEFPFPLSIIHEQLQKNYSGKIPFVRKQLDRLGSNGNGNLRDFYTKKLDELETLEENLVDDVKRNELLAKVEYALDKVEERVSQNEWLVDDMFSLADIVWLSVLDRLTEVRMTCLWEDGQRPGIEKYLKRLKARPSYQKVFSRPYLLMPWYLLMSSVA